jgi:hypothetical protein
MPILKYFWFLAAAVMAVNMVIWRGRLATLVSRDVVTKVEADRFVRWSASWLVGTPLVLGATSLAAGWVSPFCAATLAFDTAPRVLTSLVIVLGWFFVLRWIWRSSGADLLARVGPVLGKQPVYGKTYSPAAVRAVVTLLVLASAIGTAIGWRAIQAAPPELSCSTSKVAG